MAILKYFSIIRATLIAIDITLSRTDLNPETTEEPKRAKARSKSPIILPTASPIAPAPPPAPLASINTLPPNANYALVIIVELTVTAQISQYVNVQSLLQTFTAFASSQCQSQSQPQISYSGNSFTVIYQYNCVTGSSFSAFLIAVNGSQSSSSLQVTVAMGGNTVVTATINTPGQEYAYFLFSVALVFSGG